MLTSGWNSTNMDAGTPTANASPQEYLAVLKTAPEARF
jgi:hypothetical protein